MIKYKLVTQDWKSYGGMEWAIGKTNKALKSGNEMCTNQVLHCYSHPLIAAFCNPIHADIINPILLEIEVDKIVATDGLKCASKEQTPIREIPFPTMTTTQRVAAAILLVEKGSAGWEMWASNWLSGKDRSYAAANAADAANAAYAAYAAADAANAAYAADYAAANAANAAAHNTFEKKLISVLERVIKEY